ncbi:probable E3 ubiquitin-protein ligase HERC4 isoform X2 [Oryzias melastigma]|uniref:probable E3 ubiquitin-protein ligase HERC4 isoform X2 n=1 Tax=Oryzias melastigma TaxID=30732 RepID=UPI000CF7D836|nr:probable E3 ubiquitin-protein ligase HERC4 isoform X2 [Oryzias melastigma]
MLSWGEDCRRGFWLKDSADRPVDGGVQLLRVSFHTADLSARTGALAFLKTNGNAFVMRTSDGGHGARVRGKQKFVKCNERIEAVACGDDEVTLLSEKGSVYSVDMTQTPYLPRMLEPFCSIPVSQVACGSRHTVALTKEGQVYSWGQNSRGQLGLGKKGSSISSPQHVRSLSTMPLVQVSAGDDQSFALSVSGSVFGWGRNDCGQLGLGDSRDRNAPTSVDSLNLKKTVSISCGKDHTAVLTKHGTVFTFGSGQFGQLGHNSSRNELRPRLVAELWGAKVTRIACGRYHTLVLQENNKIYSFGCNDQNQLGRSNESHPSVPLPVLMPQDIGGAKIRTIFAGENCSFAVLTTNEKLPRDSNSGNIKAPLCLENMVDRWTSESDMKLLKKIKQEIHRTFSSASCLNRSFLEKKRDKHFQTSPKYHGLDLKRAQLTFKKLVKKKSVWKEVEAALLHLLPLLDKNPVGVEGLRIYLLLNELLRATQKQNQQQSAKLAEAVAAAVTRLSAKNLQVIGDWWSSLMPSRMVRHVKVWKQAVSVILSAEDSSHTPEVRNLLLVLQYMHDVNNRVAESQRLPDSIFCLKLSEAFLDEDLVRWYLRSCGVMMMPEPCVLPNFSFVLDLEAKMMIFQNICQATKVAKALEELTNSPFWSFMCDIPVKMEMVLDLRRASVLEDTFKQLAATDQESFKKPLQVFFDGNPEVDNLYVKDFFYEVFHEMVSPEYGMFMFNDSKTLAWFPSKVPQEDQRFFLFGVLCGLALYNQVIVFLPFPLVLFKKLVGVRPSLEDLREFSPAEYKTLDCILHEYTDDVLENLLIDFQIIWDKACVDLDPAFPEKPVTGQNKKEFVDAYVNHAFNTSVKRIFQEFERGFFKVCDREMVKLFRPEELHRALVGNDFHDWEKLKQNTLYEGGYDPSHPYIVMFWEVFDELSENQKVAFIWFVTGYERLPISALDTIKIRKINDNIEDGYYPESETCFRCLDLPQYSSKEIMKEKLVEALSSNRRISQ